VVALPCSYKAITRSPTIDNTRLVAAHQAGMLSSSSPWGSLGDSPPHDLCRQCGVLRGPCRVVAVVARPLT
jgi:hypothetical protein